MAEVIKNGRAHQGWLIALSVLLFQSFLAFILAFQTRSVPVYFASLIAATGICYLCRVRFPPLFACSILLALSILFQKVPIQLWNPYILPTVAFFLCALCFSHILRRERWLKKGRLTTVAAICTALVILVSSGALVLWVKLANPDLSQATNLEPKVSVPLLVFGALVFSVINAATEELIFRGVLWDALESVVTIPAVILTQAVFFGAIHYQGFPSGWVGMSLAFIYALFLGALRVQTKGLLVPFFAHITSDLTIFAIIAFLRTGGP